MLYNNYDVLQYFTENNGKLIHLYGEPDAGRTQTVFTILKHMTSLEKICCYWVPRQEEFRRNVFCDSIPDKNYCIVGFPKESKELPAFLRLADSADLICIDNFLEYIIHKKPAEIRAIFSLLSATAYQYKTNFLLVNDLRYHKLKGGKHPAYLEYFRYYCTKHVQVEKDSDFNIHYTFFKDL